MLTGFVQIHPGIPLNRMLRQRIALTPQPLGQSIRIRMHLPPDTGPLDVIIDVGPLLDAKHLDASGPRLEDDTGLRGMHAHPVGVGDPARPFSSQGHLLPLNTHQGHLLPLNTHLYPPGVMCPCNFPNLAVAQTSSLARTRLYAICCVIAALSGKSTRMMIVRSFLTIY